MAANIPITVAYGDGIGPEIMQATLDILDAAGARLEREVIEIGEKVYLRGIPEGIEPGAWASLRRTRVFLKAPITTPQGGGYKSLNVTARTILGLYANVRPCVSYYPFVQTKHPTMDVVIVRENEEDVYGGIEYRQTAQMTECLRLISEPGSRKINRYAFEYARKHQRKKVTCFTKDNIMKISDGLFHRIFEEVGAQYPDIEKEHWIVDIGSAKLADTPEAFDVIVLPNLYGDILSDVAAQLAGSVGLAGSSNIGESCAMFEAIHGSAPRRAGQDVANPSGLLLGAVLMLVHIGQPETADRVHNAWLRTLEDGVHTYDVYREGKSSRKVGTREFAQAVIARLGQEPQKLHPARYASAASNALQREGSSENGPSEARKELVGVDVFLDFKSAEPARLSGLLQPLMADGLRLNMITNRGAKVWPDGFPETFLTDHWRTRVLGDKASPVRAAQIALLLGRMAEAGLDVIKTENLYTFDGKPGYSSGQAE
ncbi:MAG: NADP-dependent isocitrate dehydrogenase [Candidatus Eremiobacteraeota bacterium]|nr:NADP-dependent isocitrate dehydrogenase [Candidatus Eremiobacteraeota bacterium]MBC5827380.1 NADP-dependent isocitrate dehydrogenase [Candidatus Eremiobacteraeota bacterium]